MSTVADHLDAWERAGLIDRETADRLRASEAAVPDSTVDEMGETAEDRPWRASSLFGPPVAIAEVFGYLGVAFLLGAWFTWIANQSTQATNAGWVIGIGASAAALGMGVLGVVLHQGGERMQRAAGVAFLVGLASVGTAAFTLISGAGIGWPDVAVVASATTLAFAIAARAFQPALLTQLALLSALTSFVGAAVTWFEQELFPSGLNFDTGVPQTTGIDPIVLVLGSAAWWLSVAVAIGLLGLAESTSAERSGDAAAGRRAGLTRFWAGMVAIVGLATAISRSDYLGNGEYGRVLAPWIGDLGVLVVAAVLIERAFRRESSAYVFAAALGLIIALSDLNFSYLTDGVESALLVEGLILLAAGVAADRLRRRIDRVDGRPPGSAGLADESLSEESLVPTAEA